MITTTPTETAAVTAVCDVCGSMAKARRTKSSGEPRAPRGWRRFQDKLWCAECWKSNFKIVALTLPVGNIIDGEWKDLWPVLRTHWSECGRLMSWATVRMYSVDEAVRSPKGQKLGPFTVPYLYPESGQLWPNLSSGTRSALCDRARKYYVPSRWNLFIGKASLPAFAERPLPLRAQDYRLEKDGETGRILMSFRAGGRRWTVSLGNRRRFGRQLAAIDKVIAGDGLQVEALVMEKAAGRRAEDVREPGGGQRRKKEIAVRVVCWLPKSAAKEATGELPVKTGGGALLRAMDTEGERLWTLNADQLHRINGHAARIRRMGEDRKAELRQSRNRSRMYLDVLSKWSDKQGRVIDTLLHQASAWIVNFAIRRGYAAIRYDDSDHSGIPSFPWFKLKELIAQKCRANRIEFLAANAEAAEADVSDSPEDGPSDD